MADTRRGSTSLALLAFLAMSSTAMAQTPIDWTEHPPMTGVVVEDGELFVEVTDAGNYPLIVIDQPGVQPPRFSIETTIRHQDVAGIAYLEMWTVLVDGSRYFTRTLADTGPMEVMTGSSDDRPIALPFELGEGGPVPDRLEINLVTEGGGRFWLGPLTVVTATVESSTTTTTVPSPTSTIAATPTSTAIGDTVSAAGDETRAGSPGGLWLFLVIAIAAGAGSVGWVRVRRRRAEEERRMKAVDSVSS